MYQMLSLKKKKTKKKRFIFIIHKLEISKLESYLITYFKFVDYNNFDILKWWKEYKQHFIVLATITKQILLTQDFIVAVESTDGKLLDAGALV